MMQDRPERNDATPREGRMTLKLLEQLVQELKPLLTGARVDKIGPVGRDGVFVVLRRGRDTHILLLSAERPHPRMHLLSRKPAAAGKLTAFIQYLRKRLTSQRLRTVCLLNNDRVVELRFSNGEADLLLIFELTGTASNILLAGPDGGILSVLHPAGPGTTIRRRSLAPGHVYEPPAPQSRPAPGDAGISLVDSAPRDRSTAPVNRAVEQWYEQADRLRERNALRQKLTADIRRARLRTLRRMHAVEQDIAAAERADEFRLWGELILAGKDRIVRGSAAADLSTYDGNAVRVPLDPARSPRENAEDYFRKYRKARTGLPLMRDRLAATRAEAEFLNTVLDRISATDSEEVERSVGRDLAARGYAAHGPAAERRKSGQPSLPYRTIELDGWQILVGKSAAGNDHITTKLARPDDLWLHAEGMPGSHVLIRNPRKGDIDPSVFRKALSLAAGYSKGSKSGKVPVVYTKAKYVHKPRGARPGMVTLTRGKTVMTRPERG